jgi:hypothetical protein
MMKKKEIIQHRNIDNNPKIWCPYKEHQQYVSACKKNCRRKEHCQAYRDYREPRLF